MMVFAALQVHQTRTALVENPNCNNIANITVGWRCTESLFDDLNARSYSLVTDLDHFGSEYYRSLSSHHALLPLHGSSCYFG